MTTDVVDQVFGELRESIVTLVQKLLIHRINLILACYLSISRERHSVNYR